MNSPGKLYLVPTPIGNLEDMTYRAVRMLKEVDLVLAEDTRVSLKLLQHYGIENRITSHHKFNEHKKVESIAGQIVDGKNVALISDAGTPGISDPGFLLVRQCVEKGIEIECLPGATALIPALAVSGLPSGKFSFEGFLPTKKGRKKQLSLLEGEQRTMVFYESPYRLVKTLQQLSEYFGETRKCCVCRELSKLHEEIFRGSLSEAATHFGKKAVKGEIVVVVEGKGKKSGS
ncbi:16S rRNA (cytidine(1402)-2'-O)-methyltransferase [hydrothermal vent metagenome]|uniref:16S rRNA (Cytidine(1402)-2'-O)-methyltransferase n=1 Tax=hydrothermal vent metagenome TaxID=652676 RepID=A0A3B0TDJ3_9ZZZZ